MENASEALYIAFAVLVFVLALTLTITSFSSLKKTATYIVESDEVIDLATDSVGNYINYIKGNDTSTDRTVGIETIVPSMYRAYKENYKIVIIFKNARTINLQSKEVSGKNHYYIDLKDENKSTQLQAKEDLDDLLRNGLYNTLKDIKFKEQLGQYYIEDEITSTATTSPGITSTEEEGLDVNKTLKRVITYTECP